MKTTGIQRFDSDDGPRWRLVARNGEILCTSEAYSSDRMRDKGIRALVRAVCRSMGEKEMAMLGYAKTGRKDNPADQPS